MVTVGQVRRPYRHMNVHYRQDALLIIADLTKVGPTSIHPPVLLHQSGCPAAKKRQADFNLVSLIKAHFIITAILI